MANRNCDKPKFVGHLKDFLRARFSPQEFLGLSLTLGMLVLVGATWLFGAIAEDVHNREPLTTVDTRFSAWLQAHATARLTALMLLITHLHSTLGVTIMTLAVCAYCWIRKLRYWVWAFLLTVYGGMLLNVLLKNVFQRQRPHFANPIVTLTSYGFPSGHTMAATVFYGTLCALIVSRVSGWYWRVLAFFLSFFLIAFVGFSRIYLGAHYLSDVLGAMAEGLAWLALCLTAFGLVRRGKA